MVRIWFALHGIGSNYAQANFLYFKKFWGKQTIEIGKALMENWFNFKNDSGNYLIDVLLGSTPKHNARACKYLKRLGWTIVGVIPYLSKGDDMLISYITRGNNNG